MSYIKELERLGLTRGEAKVYLALLELNTSTTGPLLKLSKVSSSKIYLILENLNKKGLVSEINKNNVKHFTAKSPARLNDYLEKKESEIKEQKAEVKELIKKLETISLVEPEQEYAEILKGTAGIKTFLEHFIQVLQEKDTMYIMGATQDSIELMGKYFDEWHKKRIKKNIFCYALYNKDAIKRANYRKKTKLTETRVLPKNIENPTYAVVGSDMSGIFVFGKNPKCIVIKNKEVAKSYKEYFKILWEKSIKN